MAYKLVPILVLVILLCCGCQQARYVMQSHDRGVVAIPSNSTWPVNHREQAGVLMAGHFPEGYVVEREEEIVIGAETTHNDFVNEDADFWFGATVTTDRTEWRITYRRDDSAPPAPAEDVASIPAPAEYAEEARASR